MEGCREQGIGQDHRLREHRQPSMLLLGVVRRGRKLGVLGSSAASKRGGEQLECNSVAMSRDLDARLALEVFVQKI
eukprot:299321-Rhodomonas_salina.1